MDLELESGSKMASQEEKFHVYLELDVLSGGPEAYKDILQKTMQNVVT